MKVRTIAERGGEVGAVERGPAAVQLAGGERAGVGRRGGDLEDAVERGPAVAGRFDVRVEQRLDGEDLLADLGVDALLAAERGRAAAAGLLEPQRAEAIDEGPREIGGASAAVDRGGQRLRAVVDELVATASLQLEDGGELVTRRRGAAKQAVRVLEQDLLLLQGGDAAADEALRGVADDVLDAAGELREGQGAAEQLDEGRAAHDGHAKRRDAVVEEGVREDRRLHGVGGRGVVRAPGRECLQVLVADVGLERLAGDRASVQDADRDAVIGEQLDLELFDLLRRRLLGAHVDEVAEGRVRGGQLFDVGAQLGVPAGAVARMELDGEPDVADRVHEDPRVDAAVARAVDQLDRTLVAVTEVDQRDVAELGGGEEFDDVDPLAGAAVLVHETRAVIAPGVRRGNQAGYSSVTKLLTPTSLGRSVWVVPSGQRTSTVNSQPRSPRPKWRVRVSLLL